MLSIMPVIWWTGDNKSLYIPLSNGSSEQCFYVNCSAFRVRIVWIHRHSDNTHSANSVKWRRWSVHKWATKWCLYVIYCYATIGANCELQESTSASPTNSYTTASLITISVSAATSIPTASFKIDVNKRKTQRLKKVVILFTLLLSSLYRSSVYCIGALLCTQPPPTPTPTPSTTTLPQQTSV